MKFTLVFETERGITAENYNKRKNPYNEENIDSKDSIIQYCKDVIKYFNETLREGERERKYYTCIKGHWARDINFAGDRYQKVAEIQTKQTP